MGIYGGFSILGWGVRWILGRMDFSEDWVEFLDVTSLKKSDELQR